MSTSIEVGHIKSPDRALQLKGVGPGGFEFEKENRRVQALNRLVGNFVTEDSVIVCFIDDVEARAKQQASPDPARWQHFINASEASAREAFGPDEVRFESQMAPYARELIAQIRGRFRSAQLPNGYRLNPDQTKVIAGYGRDRVSIPLVGFKGVDDPEYPSCQVLDLAWLRNRLEKHDEVVTILHDDYRYQQTQVERLAGIFPDMNEARVTTVFVDDHGADMGWHQWFDEA